MKGKLGNVVIFGDSYSTYEGYIPEGYAVYYENNGNVAEGGVSRVENTWWHRLISRAESRLVHNNSWSGSTVCFTGYYRSYCYDSSFVTRAKKYVADGRCCGEKIDTFLIFGGTNDCWAGSPVGELKAVGVEASEEDLKAFLPAFCELLRYLKESCPGAAVINVTNTELTDEITGGMAEACREYGVQNIVLQEIEKQNGHPNETGMAQIAEQIFDRLAER